MVVQKTPIINEIISALARNPHVTRVFVSKREQWKILDEYESLHASNFSDVTRGHWPSVVIYGCPVEHY